MRAKAYDIPGVVVDGMDVTAVYEAAKKAVKRARDGKGPTIIECKTYRWQGHHVGDPAVYRQRRSKTEKEDWMARCPVANLRKEMIEAGKAEEAEIAALEERIEAEIQEAVKFAADSPYPDAEEAYTDVFQQGTL